MSAGGSFPYSEANHSSLNAEVRIVELPDPSWRVFLVDEIQGRLHILPVPLLLHFVGIGIILK
jgi:hypothetical protein